jgi:antitoxin MazE
MARERSVEYLHCRYNTSHPDMDATVSKWGNSLAIRLPRAFVKELGLTDGAAVDLSLSEGGLLVTPARPAPPCLAELLAGVTRRNLHGEVDTRAAVGREVW